MKIDEARETILSLDNVLSERMKKYIHYRSMRNFVTHFDEIQNEMVRDKIRVLFSDYIEEIKENGYDFEGKTSFDLARKYIFKIADYYKEYSNFTALMRIQVTLLYGILGDSLLYLTKIPSRIWYIPIVTVCFLLYFLFVVIFKAPKGRVYGIFY